MYRNSEYIDNGLKECQTKDEAYNFLIQTMEELYDALLGGEITEQDLENMDFYSMQKIKSFKPNQK